MSTKVLSTFTSLIENLDLFSLSLETLMRSFILVLVLTSLAVCAPCPLALCCLVALAGFRSRITEESGLITVIR
jgi:hypothetical protein